MAALLVHAGTLGGARFPDLHGAGFARVPGAATVATLVVDALTVAVGQARALGRRGRRVPAHLGRTEAVRVLRPPRLRVAAGACTGEGEGEGE